MFSRFTSQGFSKYLFASCAPIFPIFDQRIRMEVTYDFDKLLIHHCKSIYQYHCHLTRGRIKIILVVYNIIYAYYNILLCVIENNRFLLVRYCIAVQKLKNVRFQNVAYLLRTFFYCIIKNNHNFQEMFIDSDNIVHHID